MRLFAKEVMPVLKTWQPASHVPVSRAASALVPAHA